jgi:hypothetical protein
MERRKPSRGNKISFQVLLDPHRAELLSEIAKEDKTKATSLLREIAYSFIQSKASTEAYTQAQEKDESLWSNAVSTRAQTCLDNRKIRETRFPS